MLISHQCSEEWKREIPVRNKFDSITVSIDPRTIFPYPARKACDFWPIFPYQTWKLVGISSNIKRMSFSLWNSKISGYILVKGDCQVNPLGVLLSLLDELCQLAKQRTSRHQRTACRLPLWLLLSVKKLVACQLATHAVRPPLRVIIFFLSRANLSSIFFFSLFLPSHPSCLWASYMLSVFEATLHATARDAPHRSANEYNGDTLEKTSDRNCFFCTII